MAIRWPLNRNLITILFYNYFGTLLTDYLMEVQLYFVETIMFLTHLVDGLNKSYGFVGADRPLDPPPPLPYSYTIAVNLDQLVIRVDT